MNDKCTRCHFPSSSSRANDALRRCASRRRRGGRGCQTRTRHEGIEALEERRRSRSRGEEERRGGVAEGREQAREARREARGEKRGRRIPLEVSRGREMKSIVFNRRCADALGVCSSRGINIASAEYVHGGRAAFVVASPQCRLSAPRGLTVGLTLRSARPACGGRPRMCSRRSSAR
jgi:hypothetical protein